MFVVDLSLSGNMRSLTHGKSIHRSSIVVVTHCSHRLSLSPLNRPALFPSHSDRYTVPWRCRPSSWRLWITFVCLSTLHMFGLSSAVKRDGEVPTANLRASLSPDSSKEDAMLLSAIGGIGPTESRLQHIPFRTTRYLPIRSHVLQSTVERIESPEALNEVPTKVERNEFTEKGDKTEQVLTAQADHKSLLEGRSESTSTAPDDDFDFLFEDDTPKKPKSRVNKGTSSDETSPGDRSSGEGSSDSDSLLSVVHRTKGNATQANKNQKRITHPKSKAQHQKKVTKKQGIPGSDSLGTSSADFDFDIDSSSNTQADDSQRQSLGDSSALDLFGSDTGDTGDIFGFSNSSSDGGNAAANDGGLFSSSGMGPTGASDETSANPLGSILGGVLNPFAQQQSITPMTDKADEWSKENMKAFEEKMPKKMRDDGSPDSWYKQAVPQESVADLNRMRENRRIAEENRAAAPLSAVYTKATKTVPAINYLGAGYDHVRGNPVGDPSSMGDPGIRPPVLRFTYAQNEDGVSNDLTVLQPLGGYVRQYVACRQSETISELSNLSDYQNELSVDASLQGGDPIGLNSFSASTGYRDFAKEVSKKDTRTYMLKNYCMRYEAGVAQSNHFKWNVTLAFAAGVSQLPDVFDAHNPECACSAEQWRQDQNAEACTKTNVPIWISFIEQFGTHFLVRLFAGGKMTYQVTAKRSEVEKMRNMGIDVKTQLKMQLGGVSGGAGQGTSSKKNQSSSEYQMNVQKETLVIGGRPPGNVSDPAALAAWADTVEELPMPVKFEVQPLYHLLPVEKQEAFKQAVTFYSKAVGLTPQDLSALTGVTRNLPKQLTQATQVAWSGPPPGFAKCPAGQVVILGFAMHLNFKEPGTDNFRIISCPPGREKCDGVGTASSETDEGRIYILCGEEPINEIQQVVAESPAHAGASVLEASCPDETVVVGGFGISVRGGSDGLDSFSIESCTTGQTICTKAPTRGSEKNFLWMMCVDKQYPGLRELVNVAELGSHGNANKRAVNSDGNVDVKCPANSSIVLGYVMEAHTNMQFVRDKFLQCPENASECKMTGKGVDHGMLWLFDRHALFGWIICKTVNEPAMHVATDVGKAKGNGKKKKGKKGKNKTNAPNEVEEGQQLGADSPSQVSVPADADSGPTSKTMSSLKLAPVKLLDL
ncbi:perforin-like protein PLP1 [Toxoplasma gondii RUB]|uniref:Perforin-like protein PLP1 n=1 Tax=Toxoplasma gondii RUB TaxID=935652 RepID=A0A086LYQ6_TOXGO|nr:perforin-like protein PLP1 [Toxoplasma gondii RUB]